MSDVTITLRNYRCFPESGASIIVGNGITALIGPNNSGKSSFLRALYEFRPLLRVAFSGNRWVNLARTGNRDSPAQPQGLADLRDAFSDDNERDLSIELAVAPAHPEDLPSIRYTYRRYDLSLSLAYPKSGVDFDSLAAANDDEIRMKDGARRLISPLPDAAAGLTKSLYIGPFRNVIEGQSQHYDISIGESFVGTWNAWKTGVSRTENRIIQDVTQTLKKLFGFNSLEINASADRKTLHVAIDSRPYRLQELGSGLAEFIVAFGNAAISRPDYILIDEPELHLHPSLQTDFVLSLASYARIGLVFATHSIGLARTVADRLFSFKRTGNVTSVAPFEQTPNLAEFAGEMSFSSFRDLGCDTILLVEGVTDVKTVQQWLRPFDKDHRIVVLPLGGESLISTNAEVELLELKRLTPNVGVLFDSERSSLDGAPIKGRAEFADLCQKLGFKVCMTNRRALENYLTDRAVKEILGPKYSARAPFVRLQDEQPCWSKAESWRIARAMVTQEIADTDVGVFLSSL